MILDDVMLFDISWMVRENLDLDLDIDQVKFDSDSWALQRLTIICHRHDYFKSKNNKIVHETS